MRERLECVDDDALERRAKSEEAHFPHARAGRERRERARRGPVPAALEARVAERFELAVEDARALLGDEEVSSGRMFDRKGAGLHAYEDDKAADGAGGVKAPSFTLDYYDEYGRKMTQKQAFRQLSWKFHGKAPSKKNREKRMLEVEKQLQDKSEDKAMSYLQTLQAAQQSTKSAHVVLTGIHAIKPSDLGKPSAPPPSDRPKKKAKAE